MQTHFRTFLIPSSTMDSLRSKDTNLLRHKFRLAERVMPLVGWSILNALHTVCTSGVIVGTHRSHSGLGNQVTLCWHYPQPFTRMSTY